MSVVIGLPFLPVATPQTKNTIKYVYFILVFKCFYMIILQLRYYIIILLSINIPLVEAGKFINFSTFLCGNASLAVLYLYVKEMRKPQCL